MRLIRMVPRSIMLATSAGIGLYLVRAACVPAAPWGADVWHPWGDSAPAHTRLVGVPANWHHQLHVRQALLHWALKIVMHAAQAFLGLQRTEGLGVMSYDPSTLVTLGGCGPKHAARPRSPAAAQTCLDKVANPIHGVQARAWTNSL